MAAQFLRRDCPRCHVPLEEEKRPVLGPDVKVDVCPQCTGTFLDKGEIRRLTGSQALHKFLTKHVGIDSDSEIVCPGCGGIMDLEEAGGVKVDVCLNCYGLWLDAGELEQLKETDPKEVRELSPEKQAELFDADQIKRQEKARGSFLRNLFGGLRR